jgi:hypothetical protein
VCERMIVTKTQIRAEPVCRLTVNPSVWTTVALVAPHAAYPVSLEQDPALAGGWRSNDDFPDGGADDGAVGPGVSARRSSPYGLINYAAAADRGGRWCPFVVHARLNRSFR